jgi:hypothetical protein
MKIELSTPEKRYALLEVHVKKLSFFCTKVRIYFSSHNIVTLIGLQILPEISLSE